MAPLPVTVTTRTLPFLVGDSKLNLHLPRLHPGRGPHPKKKSKYNIFIYIYIYLCIYKNMNIYRYIYIIYIYIINSHSQMRSQPKTAFRSLENVVVFCCFFWGESARFFPASVRRTPGEVEGVKPEKSGPL